MRQRANLWSLGDIEGMQGLPYPDDAAACRDAFLALPQFRDQYERARLQLDDLWMSTAESVLEKNTSSFAVLPIAKLLKQGGALDRLKQQGYEVQVPD